MKRLLIFLITFIVAIGSSRIASAQHARGGGAARRPATTGLDHAETKANAHGERGIETAETKQAAHKKKKKDKKHHHSH